MFNKCAESNGLFQFYALEYPANTESHFEVCFLARSESYWLGLFLNTDAGLKINVNTSYAAEFAEFQSEIKGFFQRFP